MCQQTCSKTSLIITETRNSNLGFFPEFVPYIICHESFSSAPPLVNNGLRQRSFLPAGGCGSPHLSPESGEWEMHHQAHL